MVNKEKILLLATISMLLPGALQEAYADGESKTQRKADNRTTDIAARSARAGRGTTREIKVQEE